MLCPPIGCAKTQPHAAPSNGKTYAGCVPRDRSRFDSAWAAAGGRFVVRSLHRGWLTARGPPCFCSGSSVFPLWFFCVSSVFLLWPCFFCGRVSSVAVFLLW